MFSRWPRNRFLCVAAVGVVAITVDESAIAQKMVGLGGGMFLQDGHTDGRGCNYVPPNGTQLYGEATGVDANGFTLCTASEAITQLASAAGYGFCLNGILPVVNFGPRVVARDSALHLVQSMKIGANVAFPSSAGGVAISNLRYTLPGTVGNCSGAMVLVSAAAANF